MQRMVWIGLSLMVLMTSVLPAQSPLDYDIRVETIRRGYDGRTCWVHPRVGIIPGPQPIAVMTMLKLTVTGSDLYSPTWDMRSDDLGRTWSDPVEHRDTLGHRSEPDGIVAGVCDFTPQYHAASGKLLAIGHTVRYRNDKFAETRPRETAYSVYDPATREWSAWRTLVMPDEPRFYNSGAGCVQRVDLPDGDILLPTYYKAIDEKDARVLVMRCEFDGKTLSVTELGNELSTTGGRGFGEPSLTVLDGRYYLTLRNDEAGYITTSADGLQYAPPVRWQFDDGTDLGNYNTQQHWVTHPRGLLLVYTRKGANNDHVFRHRAPLFIAQVDTVQLKVRRDTERIATPERGARLGNFGVTYVSPEETWITGAEWMQTWSPKIIIPVDNPRGADNSIYLARLRWKPAGN
jgi:hypothetical protein